jgi:hypothetical protein
MSRWAKQLALTKLQAMPRRQFMLLPHEFARGKSNAAWKGTSAIGWPLAKKFFSFSGRPTPTAAA